MVNNTKAKQMVRRSISVTKNEKQLFTDTKTLKNASTPEEKIAAAKKIATDIQKDPYAQLLLQEKILLQEIKELEDKINQESSYISYFNTEEVKEDKEMLEELYDDLEDVQKKLNKASTIQRKTTSLLNNWAVGTLIATVGLAVADQLITGGAGRTAIMSGAGKVGSGLKTAWSYAPSGQTAFSYGSWTISIGLLLFEAKRLKNKIAALIAGEEEELSPDQEKLAELYEMLEEQNKKIAELEVASKKQ